jgi:glutathione peroxidase
MTIYDFTVKDAMDESITLSDYAGKVLLIVNTATGCGFTPQYDGLEALYEKYQDKGFEILDFPCNQFFGQAPGSNEEIASFCKINFGVTFKQFSKIDVNGENTLPLYAFLKEQAPEDIQDVETEEFVKKLATKGHIVEGSDIKWNFTKFLINQEGTVVARYAPNISLETIEQEIEKLLK